MADAHQRDLFSALSPRPKPSVRRHMRATSMEQVNRKHDDGSLAGRKEIVERGLRAYGYKFNQAPTSGELARWLYDRGELGPREHTAFVTAIDFGTALLICRRGLSDCVKAQLIESVPAGKRICAEKGTMQETWQPTKLR